MSMIITVMQSGTVNIKWFVYNNITIIYHMNDAASHILMNRSLINDIGVHLLSITAL